jgi:hypothetical protein
MAPLSTAQIQAMLDEALDNVRTLEPEDIARGPLWVYEVNLEIAQQQNYIAMMQDVVQQSVAGAKFWLCDVRRRSQRTHSMVTD